MADIATGCGKFVAQAAMTGKADPTRTRKYDWPEQRNPTSLDWTIWQEALNKALCIQQKFLCIQLGRWLKEGSSTWLYFELEERLYHRNDYILF